MFEYTHHGEAELGARIDEHNMIHLVMGGNLGAENFKFFHEWADAVRQCMVEVDKRQHGNVLTLIDTQHLREFDSKMVEELRKLMAFNKNYATRTAVFGAPSYAQMIVKTMLAITRRTNMKLFNTREQALAWLEGK